MHISSKKDGALIVNDWRIDPMPVVIGAAEYPENILENLKKDHKVYTVKCNGRSEKSLEIPGYLT